MIKAGLKEQNNSSEAEIILPFKVAPFIGTGPKIRHRMLDIFKTSAILFPQNEPYQTMWDNHSNVTILMTTKVTLPAS